MFSLSFEAVFLKILPSLGNVCEPKPLDAELLRKSKYQEIMETSTYIPYYTYKAIFLKSEVPLKEMSLHLEQ